MITNKIQTACESGLQSTSKRWKAVDQILYIFTVQLNPFLRDKVFSKKDARIGPMALAGKIGPLFQRFFRRASESIVTEFIDYMAMRGRYGKAEFWDTVSAIATDARRHNLEPDVFMVWDLMESGSERSDLASLATRLFSVTTNSAGCERLFSTMGIIHNKLRNRLHSTKVAEIAKVKQYLRFQQRLIGELPVRQRPSSTLRVPSPLGILQDDTALPEAQAIALEEEDILSPEDFEREARHWLDDMPNPILQDELTEDFIWTLDDLFDQHSDSVYDPAWAHGQERVRDEEDFFSVIAEFLEGDNIDEAMRREVLQATEGYMRDI